MDAQQSVTGIPLEEKSIPPKSRLGEGEDEEAFLQAYASTALQPRRIAELQSGRGLLNQRRAPAKARYLGKRKQRRRENSNLGSLAEVSEGGKNQAPRDTTDVQRATFPVPPPTNFARKAAPAAARKPTPDPKSAQMGRYLLSMRGIQRRLRTVLKSDSRTADLVRLVEKEIIDWIYNVQVWEPHGVNQSPRAIDAPLDQHDVQDPAILEVERSTVQLKWLVKEPFLRFLVHLVARLWDVNSCSRTEADGRRMTTLVRPNLVHGDPEQARGAPGAIATPNTTEWEVSSMTGSMLHSTDSEDFSDAFGAAGEDRNGPPFSPWQTIRGQNSDADVVSSSEDEGPADQTFTASSGRVERTGEPLRRVLSISSSDRSEFGDDEDAGLAESTGDVRITDGRATRL